MSRPGIVTAFSIYVLLLSLVVGEARGYDESVRCMAVQHRLMELRAEITLLEEEEVTCLARVTPAATHPPLELALPVTESLPDVPSTTSGDRRRQTSGTAPLSFAQPRRKSSALASRCMWNKLGVQKIYLALRPAHLCIPKRVWYIREEFCHALRTPRLPGKSTQTYSTEGNLRRFAQFIDGTANEPDFLLRALVWHAYSSQRPISARPCAFRCKYDNMRCVT
jgi:hypothetical protein